MIFPSKILAKFFDRLYLESGNYRLVIFLIVPVLYNHSYGTVPTYLAEHGYTPYYYHNSDRKFYVNSKYDTFEKQKLANGNKSLSTDRKSQNIFIFL